MAATREKIVMKTKVRSMMVDVWEDVLAVELFAMY